MSTRNIVVVIALAALATQAPADVPDGKGSRTSVQASPDTVRANGIGCCEKGGSGNCTEAVATAATIEPRVPPQRTSTVATPLRCQHMTVAGSIETRVPPQRNAARDARPSCPCHAR
jgi:hypothetical protein